MPLKGIRQVLLPPDVAAAVLLGAPPGQSVPMKHHGCSQRICPKVEIAISHPNLPSCGRGLLTPLSGFTYYIEHRF